jgi:hypothetical protein
MSKARGIVGSVYRPKYRSGSGEIRESAVWWIRYSYHGTKYRESSKSEIKTVAKDLLKHRTGRDGQTRHDGDSTHYV